MVEEIKMENGYIILLLKYTILTALKNVGKIWIVRVDLYEIFVVQTNIFIYTMH